MNITIVAGARPNFMKIAPLIHAIKRHKAAGEDINTRVIYTGKEDDPSIAGKLFEDLNMERPDTFLGAQRNSLNQLAAEIMTAFEKELTENPADIVMVVDDFTSTMACAIVAKKMGVKVAHLVAGTRSFDMNMPKEVNRMITDGLSDILLTAGYTAGHNLRISGTEIGNIHMTGNILMDTLRENLHKAVRPAFMDGLKLTDKGYLLLTINRKAMTSDTALMKRLLENILEKADGATVIAPLHNYAREAVKATGIQNDRLLVIPPVSYLEFCYLEKNARGIITDSGNVAEEATFLGVPCITLTNYTEHKETVTVGTNELACEDPELTGQLVGKIMAGQWKKAEIPERWDGHSAERIVRTLIEEYKK